MGEEKKYVKMSELVGSEFTVDKVYGFEWKKWDAASNRMLVSEKWEEGYSKSYNMETDKGKLSVSSSQLGSMLEAVSEKGVADVNHRTFGVKSNNKTGKEIRYFINAVWEKPAAPKQDEPIDVNEIPW